MRELNYELKKLCQRNRDGSYGTRADRERILDLIANQLHDMGFRHMHASSLKGKHVVALVARWKAEGISPGTMKNRMAQLRWVAEKNGTPKIMAASNDAYGIANRVYVTNVSKARTLDSERLARMSDLYSPMSLKLQSAFGLRRKESIMMRAAWADRGDRLVLQANWTKGGRAREIPIRTAEQRQVLDEAKQLAGKGSLIPNGMRYVDQLRRFEAQCRKVGIDHVHGLRHRYAQERYRELTGWECPANGGPTSRQLTPEQKRIDREARTTITQELGHERLQVLATYLGW
jgi:hypothetical protein